jgi:hypothetical protein
MKAILALFLSSSLLLTSCNLFDNYGKKVSFGKSEVYYKGDGVSETDAKKLGDFLIQTQWLDSTKGASVQVTKDKDAYWVRFVYDKAVYDKNTQQINLSFWYLQDILSQNVFGGQPTRIALADNKFKDFETLEPVTKVMIGQNVVYYRGNGIKESDAKTIGEKLGKEEFFPFVNGGFLLSKEKGAYQIRFLPNPEKIKDGEERYYAILTNLQYIFSKYTLAEDVRLIVMDNDFNDVKQFGEPTAEQKDYMDKAMTGQQTNANPDQDTEQLPPTDDQQ